MERDDHFTKAFYELPVSGFPVRVGEMDGSQPYTLGQGDILIIGPGESHCIFPSSHEARRVCVMFEPGLLFSQDSFAPYRACFSQIPKHSKDWPEDTRLRVKNGISKIYEKSGCLQPGWELFVHASLTEIAAYIVRTLPKIEARPQQNKYSLLRSVLDKRTQSRGRVLFLRL